MPSLRAPFVGALEIATGAGVLARLFTRAAATLVLVDIAVAIATTNVPMVHVAEGFWAAAHEARTHWSMLFGLAFLLASAGAGLARSMRGSRLKTRPIGVFPEAEGYDHQARPRTVTLSSSPRASWYR